MKKLTIDDVVIVGANRYEYVVTKIEENVATLQRNDEIKYYHVSDIDYDDEYGFEVYGYIEETMSPSTKHKLSLYQVQNNVYQYNSLDELKEIYTLLNYPSLKNNYAIKKHNFDEYLKTLNTPFGLLVFWKEFDAEWNCSYKYCEIIFGAKIINCNS